MGYFVLMKIVFGDGKLTDFSRNLHFFLDLPSRGSLMFFKFMLQVVRVGLSSQRACRAKLGPGGPWTFMLYRRNCSFSHNGQNSYFVFYRAPSGKIPPRDKNSPLNGIHWKSC